MKIRLGVNTPPADYADGQILTAQNINDIVDILKGAINNNYDDLVKIIAGDNSIHVFDTLEALQAHAETLTVENDGDYGLVLDFPNAENEDVNSLRLYTFSFAEGEFVFEKDNLSFIDIIAKQTEIEALYDGINDDFPTGIKTVTDDIYIQLGTKVDKETGKVLSTEDFTTALRNKLNSIETGAQVNKLETIDITGYGTTPGTPISINIVDKKATINLNQKADLVGGKIPADQLPASVDQVLEFATLSAFPTTGVSSRLYVALDTNRTYRWSGTQYVEVSE
jgi:hypothetical protein